MRVLNALGFDFGAFGAGETMLLAAEQPQTAYTLPTSRVTGRQVIPVERSIAQTPAGTVTVTKEVDAGTGKAMEVVYDQGNNVIGAKAVSNVPWLWIAGGLAAAGAFFMLRKKRGGALSGYRRRRRR